jgi:hypothetical protein
MSKQPVILTENGKPSKTSPDARAYQELLDTAAPADVFEAIRQGLDDFGHERIWPAREVFDAIRRSHHIRRDVD